jgi:hypothetical protein
MCTLAVWGVERYLARKQAGPIWQPGWWVVVALGGTGFWLIVHLATRGMTYPRYLASSVVEAFPLAAVGFYGMLLLWHMPPSGRRRAMVFMAVTAMVHILGTVYVMRFWGAGGWGPRYSLSTLPIFVALAWDTAHSVAGDAGRPTLRKALMGSVGLLLLVSAAAQTRGVYRVYWEKAQRQERLDAFRALGSAHPIITSDGSVLPLVAAIYEDIDLLAVVDEDELAGAIDLLCRNDIDTFWWAPGYSDLITADVADRLGLTPTMTHEGMTEGFDPMTYTQFHIDCTGRD